MASLHWQTALIELWQGWNLDLRPRMSTPHLQAGGTGYRGCSRHTCLEAVQGGQELPGEQSQQLRRQQLMGTQLTAEQRVELQNPAESVW